MIECKKQTDEELVQSVLLKRDFFGCLIDRYEAKIRRYIRRIMPGVGDDEDDLMQDIFIKAYVNIQSFDTGLKFSSWIYRITYNHTISYYRKHKRHAKVLSSEDNQLMIERMLQILIYRNLWIPEYKEKKFLNYFGIWIKNIVKL